MVMRKRANLVIFMKTTRKSAGGKVFIDPDKAKRFFLLKKRQGFAVRNRTMSQERAFNLRKKERSIT